MGRQKPDHDHNHDRHHGQALDDHGDAHDDHGDDHDDHEEHMADHDHKMNDHDNASDAHKAAHDAHKKHGGDSPQYKAAAKKAHAASKEARSLRKLNDEFYHHTQSTTSSASKTWTTIFSEKLTDQPPMLIYNDNKSTLQWLNNPCHHAKTKHIETPVLSVRRLVYEFKLLAAEYISTSVQVADVMTKPLGKTKHWIHTRIMLGGRLPCPKTSQSEGG